MARRWALAWGVVVFILGTPVNLLAQEGSLGDSSNETPLPPEPAETSAPSTTVDTPASEGEGAGAQIENSIKTEEKSDHITDVQVPPQEKSPTMRPRVTLDEKVMGSWRIGIGAGQANFDEKYNHISRLYRSDRKTIPQGSVDYYFWDWYATMGISLRGGFLKTSGKAAKLNSVTIPYDQDIQEDEVDPNSNTELTLIPLQLVGVIQMTPFSKRWIGLTGWMGAERQFVQEVRFPPDDKSKTGGTEKSDNPTTRVNRGWNNGAVVGGGLSLRIDRLDTKSAASLRFMGIRAIYLMPYFEKVVLNTDKYGPFGHTTIGAMFTFESIR